MSHTPNTRTTTRDGRQYRKVMCSCGEHIITTDSISSAQRAIMAHQSTPECSKCHHRSRHDPRYGCLYITDAAAAVDNECPCGDLSLTPMPLCPACDHPAHPDKSKHSSVSIACQRCPHDEGCNRPYWS